MAEPRYRAAKKTGRRRSPPRRSRPLPRKALPRPVSTTSRKRAGVSKGLLYLYFKTKEELFKAVVKSVVIRRVDSPDRECRDNRALVGRVHSRAAVVVSTESSRVTGRDRYSLTDCRRTATSRSRRLLLRQRRRQRAGRDSAFVKRGVDRGEFRESAYSTCPTWCSHP